MEKIECAAEIGENTFSVYVRPTVGADGIAITWTRIDGTIKHDTSIKLSKDAAIATRDALIESLSSMDD